MMRIAISEYGYLKRVDAIQFAKSGKKLKEPVNASNAKID